MAVEKCTEPGRRSELQRPVLARLRFKTPAREVVRTRRNHHTGGNLERHQKCFPVRIPVELEAIARLETHVDRRHEIFPGFHDSFGVRTANVFVLEEFLAYPRERAILRRPRLEIAAGGRAPHTGPRQETEQRFEGFPVLIDARGAVPQVVRIVDLESPADLAAWADITLRCSTPRTEQQILVSTKLGSSPYGISAHQRVSPEARRITIRKDRANSQVLIEVVGNPTRQ